MKLNGLSNQKHLDIFFTFDMTKIFQGQSRYSGTAIFACRVTYLRNSLLKYKIDVRKLS